MTISFMKLPGFSWILLRLLLLPPAIAAAAPAGSTSVSIVGEDFDSPTNNFAAALAEHVSWGWFDYRRKGEALDEGYQSPPVNWGLGSGRKRAFFKCLGEITGANSP